MKTKRVLGLVVLVLGGGLLALAAAQSAASSPQDKSKPPLTAVAAPVPESPSKPPLYDSAGRRDPFKDLLGGTESRERASAEGPELSISELRLIGIAKARGQIYALIVGPQGFPYKVKEGDKFADGYVVKITLDTVTFRQTMDRGLRLPNPRDVVKEINPEER